MLQLTPHNVGTAPGTMTMTIPSAAMRLGGGALVTVYPTDFDLSKMYGYLPYNNGWISGKLNNPVVAALGAEAASMTPEQQMVALQAKVAALDVQTREEELRTQRSTRIWTAVAGVVGVAGLVVSIYALKRSR